MWMGWQAVSEVNEFYRSLGTRWAGSYQDETWHNAAEGHKKEDGTAPGGKRYTAAAIGAARKPEQELGARARVHVIGERALDRKGQGTHPV